jgi:uncharacterized protein (UPF0332 family)
VKQESSAFLRKAERALRAAEILLQAGDAESAAGRAYYAMLHAAQALLRQSGFRYCKHSGVHSSFGEHFAKTGVFDPKYHRWILAAFNDRLKGDYDIDVDIDSETAAILIEQARELLSEAIRYLEVIAPGSE